MQKLHCIICHPIELSNPSCSQMTWANLGVLNYNHNQGNTSLKKHVDMAHPLILEQYVKEVAKKHALQTPATAKKKATKQMFVNCNKIRDFFGSIEPYKKLDMP